MIFPLSPFGISWMVLMTVGLFYTALLTPPVVAFHWLDSVCDQVPTLWADTVFDVLFLADILMTFLTGKSPSRLPRHSLSVWKCEGQVTVILNPCLRFRP